MCISQRAKLSLSTLWNSPWKNDLCHWRKENVLCSNITLLPTKKYNQGEKLRLIILFLRKEEKFLQRSCEMNEEESRFIYENMGKILHNIASRAALQKQEKIHQ